MAKIRYITFKVKMRGNLVGIYFLDYIKTQINFAFKTSKEFAFQAISINQSIIFTSGFHGNLLLAG